MLSRYLAAVSHLAEHGRVFSVQSAGGLASQSPNPYGMVVPITRTHGIYYLGLRRLLHEAQRELECGLSGAYALPQGRGGGGGLPDT